MEGVRVICKDFRAAVEEMDGPGVIFLADPCWPKSEGVYEYTIEGRHRELVEVLQKAQGHYILTGQASDEMLRAMAGVPYLYWVYIGGWKEVIGSSFPLEDEMLQRFDPMKYGYRVSAKEG